MPVKLTYTEVVRTLEQVAQEQPAFICPKFPDENGVANCRYVVDEEPCCIVGQVLHRLGVPLDILAENEGMGARVPHHSTAQGRGHRRNWSRSSGRSRRADPSAAVSGRRTAVERCGGLRHREHVSTPFLNLLDPSPGTSEPETRGLSTAPMTYWTN